MVSACSALGKKVKTIHVEDYYVKPGWQGLVAEWILISQFVVAGEEGRKGI